MLKIRSIGQAVQKLSSEYSDRQTDTQTALDPMTFTSEHDLDMVVTYFHAKNQTSRSSNSKVIIRIHTDRNSNRQTGVKPLPTCIRG